MSHIRPAIVALLLLVSGPAVAQQPANCGYCTNSLGHQVPRPGWHSAGWPLCRQTPSPYVPVNSLPRTSMCNDFGNHIPHTDYLAALSQTRIPVKCPEAIPNLQRRDDIWPTDKLQSSDGSKTAQCRAHSRLADGAC